MKLDKTFLYLTKLVFFCMYIVTLIKLEERPNCDENYIQSPKQIY